MAVRVFDLTEPQSSRLEVVGTALRRQDLRRVKRRYALLGFILLALPFFGALVLLGVSH